VKRIQFSLGRLLVCVTILACFLAIDLLRTILFWVGCVAATLVVLMILQSPITYLLWRCGRLPSRESPIDDE
jgi:hypothetical protein